MGAEEKQSILAEDVCTGLVRLILTELSIDVQWLARVTAKPETIIELLLELTRNERCPKIRGRYQEIRAEERLMSYLKRFKSMGEPERTKLSNTIMGNKLFLIP